MSQNHELALRQEGGNALTNLTVRDMIQLGNSLVGTGFLPNSIKTPEQAMAIMLKGQELRVPPMYSLSNIVVVNGKPSCSAELMLALIQRDFGQRAIRVKSSDDTHCTVEYRLEGWDDVQSYTFTIKQAEIAGLFKNSVWKQYPAAMLRARAISAVARMAFPGSIGGMYVPGELGEAVTVNSDGEIVSVSGATANVVDVPDPEHEMRRLHAVAANQGIDHDALHNWANQACHAGSLREVNTEWLSGLADKLADDTFAEKFLHKYGFPSDGANVIEAEVVEPASLFDGNDLAQLNADADRIQRREQVTR